MSPAEQATVSAMEDSERASVRIFALIYRNSKEEVRDVMRRDPVWIEYATEEVLRLATDEQKELAELRRWKRDFLEMESSWDVQAVGKAMGRSPGDRIRPAILPWILLKKAEVEKLRAINAQLRAACQLVVDSGGNYSDLVSSSISCRAAIANADQ